VTSFIVLSPIELIAAQRPDAREVPFRRRLALRRIGCRLAASDMAFIRIAALRMRCRNPASAPRIVRRYQLWLLRSAPKSVYSRHRTDRTIRVGDEGWFPVRIAADTFFDRFA